MPEYALKTPRGLEEVLAGCEAGNPLPVTFGPHKVDFVVETHGRENTHYVVRGKVVGGPHDGRSIAIKGACQNGGRNLRVFAARI